MFRRDDLEPACACTRARVLRVIGDEILAGENAVDHRRWSAAEAATVRAARS
jgi:hypothetical protein